MARGQRGQQRDGEVLIPLAALGGALTVEEEEEEVVVVVVMIFGPGPTPGVWMGLRLAFRVTLVSFPSSFCISPSNSRAWLLFLLRLPHTTLENQLPHSVVAEFFCF